ARGATRTGCGARSSARSRPTSRSCACRSRAGRSRRAGSTRRSGTPTAWFRRRARRACRASARRPEPRAPSLDVAERAELLDGLRIDLRLVLVELARRLAGLPQAPLEAEQHEAHPADHVGLRLGEVVLIERIAAHVVQLEHAGVV